MPSQRPGDLRGIPFFKEVPDETLARYGLWGSVMILRPGEDLVAAGQPRTRVWFMRSGWVRVRQHSPGGQEVTAALCGPGELLACASYFGLETDPQTISAITAVEVVAVPAKAFESWLGGDARAACRLIEALGRRLRESSELKAINAERAPLRLRLTLGWLARKFGREIPATRALLADLTGLRAETCSRVLSRLQRRGVVRTSRGQIQVLRQEPLEDV